MKTKDLTGPPVPFFWGLKTALTERYAWQEDCFNDSEIEQINRVADDLGFMDASFAKDGGFVVDHGVRKTEVTWIPPGDVFNHWIFQRLTAIINDVNQEYFNYDLDYIENLQYSVYRDGGFYDKHLDTNYESVGKARKLSFVIHLTDPSEYEGGELLLHLSSSPTKPPCKKGTIVFFPSWALHEVTPVTKGTRITLVGWCTGPVFR